MTNNPPSVRSDYWLAHHQTCKSITSKMTYNVTVRWDIKPDPSSTVAVLNTSPKHTTHWPTMLVGTITT